MPSTELLLRENEILQQLYDVDSMLSITKSIAQGYISLLGGNNVESNSNNDNSNADLALSFMALTQGNVVDACFGVLAVGARGEITPAVQSARTAKSLLMNCSISTADEEQFQRLAVNSYCSAFQECVIFQEQMGKLNCCTKCFSSKKIRKKAELQLRIIFLNLAKIIAETR